MALSDYVKGVEEAIKRDDIRGVYGKNIDAQFAHELGRALAGTFRRTSAVAPVNVAVGHDMRLSGPVLAESLCRGLEQGGCRPVRMGLAGTELVGFLPAKYQQVIDGGVMVTASHNPKDYNGFKFFGRAGLPLSLAASSPVGEPENEMQRIALAMKKRKVPTQLRWEDFAPDYARTAIERGGCDFEKAVEGAHRAFRVAVEGGNGMGGPIMQEVARLVPQFEWTLSNERPDGSFPVIVPNPLDAAYQRMVSQLVAESKSDVGVCFDGDADRVAISDETGRSVPPPVVAALIGKRLRQRLGPEAKIAHNLACSWVIADTLGERENVTGDGSTVLTPVGYGKIKGIMHGDPSIAFGVEHSGHYMFREFWCSDSGMLAGLLMLELVAEMHCEGKTLSGALAPLRERYFESGEINFQLPPGRSVESVIEEAAARFRDEAVRIYVVAKDGCRLVDSYPPSGVELDVADVRAEAENWWFCMRKSGTEARAGEILRLYVEACGERALMERKRDELVKLVGPQLRM